MIGIILTGHGKISSGIKSSVDLVMGSVDKLEYYDFTQDIAPEVLESKISEGIDKLNEDGVLILTDIAGGTPFKLASVLSLNKANVKVVAGMNLPMVLEVISEREYSDIEKIYDFSIEVGKSEIQGFEVKIKEQNNDFEDGI
ncbi:PTS galactosamine/N-acetylgalactosamine transporter subunit IIA [Pseudostreptobacillus hongkongensis]|uniref:PTS galactosamine/N-acetylgalactosamine transporter subunit IIA n=1 Tax=Pseudostreptobacillus hongkongensis TaxID=1162717 RepID=UPI0028D63B4A|nr:PTS galactosamine/N-acetylgalactosamine transporter subunit IIA [Pseudostreptobacillus hongkongensis]